jgi:ketosteroid isomerase-like protein
MPQEHETIARRSIETFNARGVDAALGCFSPDVLVYPLSDWVEASIYRGHDGLRTVLAVWTENFDDFEIAASEFREVGDRVLMLGQTRGRSNGVAMSQPLGIVFSDFRDGRIGEVRNFASWQQALEAAELAE